MTDQRQALVLCGGLGTRLGPLTSNTPKPLLPVQGEPFLDVLLFELGRNGFQDIVLLAGFAAEKVSAYVEASSIPKRFGQTVRIVVEPTPSGTAGALWYARDLIQDEFLLLNGDSWFDINLLGHFCDGRNSQSLGMLALREIEDASRYGVVELENGQITKFYERPPSPTHRLVNGGIYYFRRAILDHISPLGSLEMDVLPKLAEMGKITGQIAKGYFIDIGVPDSFARAQIEIPAQRQRPAVFVDRDGVLNHDHGYVGSKDRFEWIEGSKSAIRMWNDLGYFVFVITNQAGVARGFYKEEDVKILHQHMRDDLMLNGAHIDDFRYCPFHPEGKIESYTKVSPWRKPAPGMILDILENWTVDTSRSLLIGDQPTDVLAGEAAGLKSFLFNGKNLAEFVTTLPVV